MPDLGSAKYTLILDSKAFDASMAKSEARATAATSAIAGGAGKADAALASMGAQSERTAVQVSASSGKMAAGYERAGTAAQAAGAQAGAGARATTAAAGEAAAAVEASSTRQASAWSRATTAMMTNDKKMRSVARGLNRHITLPTVAIAGAAGAMAFKFNESMHQITTLVGASDKQMAEYREGIEELSGSVAKAPRELADALYFVTSSGFEGAEALSVLEASAKASAAGLGQTLTVADAVTSAVNAYGIEALSASRATDILLATVREGKAEPEELAGSIGRVLPIAEAMGVTFGEVGGMIAAMSLGGLDASEATTALRATIGSLLKQTKEGRKTLEAYGTSIEEVRAAVKDRGLFPVLTELRQKLDMSDLVKVFPNIRALTGVLNATGRGLQKNAGILKDVEMAADDTDRAFDKMAQTNEFKLRRSWVELQREMIKLGNLVIPIAAKILAAIVAVVSAFGGLPGPVKTAVGVFVIFAATLGPLVLTVWAFVRAMKAMNAMMLLAGMNGGKAKAGVGGLRMALIGKVGLAGAAFAAAFGLTTLAIKLLNLEGPLKSVGSWAYDAAQALGLVNDASLGVPQGKGGLRDSAARIKARDLYGKLAGQDVPDEIKDHIVKNVMGSDWTWHDVVVTASHTGQKSPMDAHDRAGMGGTKKPSAAAGTAPLLTDKKPGKDDDKKKPKTVGFTAPSITELPIGLQLRMTRAERTKTLNDDLKLLREEEAFYRRKLQNAKLSSKQRLELEQALTDVLGRERSLIEQGARDRSIITMPKQLQKRLAAAKKTTEVEDDLKVWRLEKKWLKQRLQNKKLTLMERVALQKELERTNKKIEALKKKEADERARHEKRLMELQAVMDARGSFFSQFAGNIFGIGPGGLSLTVDGDRRGGVNKNLTVNQNNHYNEIPRDRHGHARHMQRAASASMDTM